MSRFRLKPGKIGGAAVGVYKKAEAAFTDAFLEEDASKESGFRLKTGRFGEAVVRDFGKIEGAVVGGYKKIEDAFIDAFLEASGDPAYAEASEEIRPGRKG